MFEEWMWNSKCVTNTRFSKLRERQYEAQYIVVDETSDTDSRWRIRRTLKLSKYSEIILLLL